jgi:hypothetical protein
VAWLSPSFRLPQLPFNSPLNRSTDILPEHLLRTRNRDILAAHYFVLIHYPFGLSTQPSEDMSPMQGKPHRYSHLTSEEEEARSFISLEEKDAQLDLARRGSKSPLRKALPWLLHLLLLTAYLVGVFCWKRPLLIKESFDCKSLARVSYVMFRLTGYIAPSDVPIEYETVQFFAGVGNDISEYQGPSTPQTDAAWSNLLDGKSFNVSLTEMCTR